MLDEPALQDADRKPPSTSAISPNRRPAVSCATAVWELSSRNCHFNGTGQNHVTGPGAVSFETLTAAAHSCAHASHWPAMTTRGHQPVNTSTILKRFASISIMNLCRTSYSGNVRARSTTPACSSFGRLHGRLVTEFTFDELVGCA